MTYAIVIPARLNSKRLPKKPLIKLNGIPMILLIGYRGDPKIKDELKKKN